MAIGQAIELDPYETVELAFVTSAADSRYDALAQIARYDGWDAIERVSTHAHAQAEQELRQLALESEELAQMQQLLSALIYPNPALPRRRRYPGRQSTGPGRPLAPCHLRRLPDLAGSHPG